MAYRIMYQHGEWDVVGTRIYETYDEAATEAHNAPVGAWVVNASLPIN